MLSARMAPPWRQMMASSEEPMMAASIACFFALPCGPSSVKSMD